MNLRLFWFVFVVSSSCSHSFTLYFEIAVDNCILLSAICLSTECDKLIDEPELMRNLFYFGGENEQIIYWGWLIGLQYLMIENFQLVSKNQHASKILNFTVLDVWPDKHEWIPPVRYGNNCCRVLKACQLDKFDVQTKITDIYWTFLSFCLLFLMQAKCKIYVINSVLLLS